MAAMAQPSMNQPSMIRVIDLETTGNAPPAHAVIEIGWQDVALGADGRWELHGEGGAILVNPGRPIPPITMAVHHIRYGPDRGKEWREIEEESLAGFLTDRDPDVRHTAETEMARRRGGGHIGRATAQELLL